MRNGSWPWHLLWTWQFLLTNWIWNFNGKVNYYENVFSGEGFWSEIELAAQTLVQKMSYQIIFICSTLKVIGRSWRTSSLALFSSFRMYVYCHQDSEIFTRRETDVIELRNKDTVRCHWRKYTAALWERTETFSAIRTLVKKMLTTFFNTSANKRFSSWSFVKQFCSQFTDVHLHATLRVFPSEQTFTILPDIELQKYHQGVSWKKVKTSKIFLFA